MGRFETQTYPINAWNDDGLREPIRLGAEGFEEIEEDANEDAKPGEPFKEEARCAHCGQFMGSGGAHDCGG